MTDFSFSRLWKAGEIEKHTDSRKVKKNKVHVPTIMFWYIIISIIKQNMPTENLKLKKKMTTIRIDKTNSGKRERERERHLKLTLVMK